MRAPRRIVPTESYAVAIVLGVLVPFGVIVLASDLPEMTYNKTLFFLPLICGFTSALVFGGKPRRFIRLAAITYPIFHVCLIFSTLFLGLPIHRRELGMAFYMTIAIPPFFLGAMIIAMIGAVFGWLAALAIRR